MTQIIAVANQKGGVGKTTTSVNLAASLAVIKRRVLIVDMDPQGNATTGIGLDKHEMPVYLSDVLLGDAKVDEAIQTIPNMSVSGLAGGPDLTIAELEMMKMGDREYRLQKVLQSVKGNYDYIIIDCPPSLNMLTVNALVAANGVLIPMQCEYYALEGLSALIGSIETIRSNSNPKLEVIGLLRTMYDPRNNLSRDVSNQLAQHFSDTLYNTSIPRNIRLAEAPSHGLPALMYDKRSSGALAYLALAAEVIRKESSRQAA
ncbi:chromosome partitioning protein Soj [Cocleimonas flava]|uniref:Chromosome segregation ATPase n=1 Tax=Cocleimonas flava TaxID=634765 RepID=A0A4R1EZC8_9GAMM|nr:MULTISPECIES: ParA family protein [Cocleimonas]MEB8433632.1 ParA family protein [Cocleimonas sp. KMM 6892]MEC4716443.1 ParA family protein [Cocleimonas sp. KMM 6895]MEC4745664.1 ParA family protein [Cocleimonas sp. KMM 6896]TCJ85279.1 chromosome segregation ATPase [Cocleimonas flava]